MSNYVITLLLVFFITKKGEDIRGNLKILTDSKAPVKLKIKHSTTSHNTFAITILIVISFAGKMNFLLTNFCAIPKILFVFESEFQKN